jgi:glutamine synthetase
MTHELVKAEYIWIDGTEPTPRLRSKTKILSHVEPPEWGFDGSSTNQADGSSSDCILKPVYKCPDPLRGGKNLLVMCEVMNPDGTPHRTNSRALLEPVAKRVEDQDPWFGFEQEYTMFKGSRPLGWPEQGYPAPQGPFYCGVGADEAFGRDIVEEHLDACIEAGLTISGVNAEVMPGQWEFQIGPVGPLRGSDQLHLARYLLYRIAENHGVTVSLSPKPVRGDWNGAGCHTNFSTVAMRDEGGKAVIEKAIDRLEERHQLHIENYGAGIEQRLTGLHETCSYKVFRHGDSDRGASIRIPVQVQKEGRGYFEDRRPCANIDPYVVSRLMLEACCD